MESVFTVTVTDAVPVQPLFVTVTVYVVVTTGLTMIEAVVPPVLHEYVPPPVAVRVEDPPKQILAGAAVAVALTTFTVTVAQAEAVHP
jgi:hypothetical protein